MPGELIDITIPVREGMPIYPGDPPFSIERTADVAAGDHSTLSRICLGTHTGTHVDAPAHFIAGGANLDALALETLVGPARVLAIDAADKISEADLRPHGIVEGERVLLKTRNGGLLRRDAFSERFVHLSTEAAAYLAEVRPRCLGVDYLSVGGFHGNGTEVHRALLGAGVWLIEGCDLTDVRPGVYELVCLPLRVAGAEAAPARAFLRRA